MKLRAAAFGSVVDGVHARDGGLSHGSSSCSNLNSMFLGVFGVDSRAVIWGVVLSCRHSSDWATVSASSPPSPCPCDLWSCFWPEVRARGSA